MIIYIFNILLFFLLLFSDTPVYPNDFSSIAHENYTLKISRKFSKTYCNSIKFGISKEGALNFAIGETNKEFLNNKLNKFIDYSYLNKNILSNIENNCQIFDFPVSELGELVFKY
tara:strand:- start:77 stop:421 length:345 start_codon:yes stop_codon:yes gene_type:complete